MGTSVLIVAIILSGGMLFFGDQMSVLTNIFAGQNKSVQIDKTGRILKLAYLFQPKDLNPFSEDPATQTRLRDVYEGLVQMDDSLIVKPSLAISYGLINSKEWQIKLREGVKFHDQSLLDAEDVVDSLKMAQALQSSVVSDLMASIDSFSRVDDRTVKIVTKKPDPLFLNKLSKLPILPSGYLDFSKPDGTGAYRLTDSADLADLKYQRFEGYWGDPAFFGQVEIKAFSNKLERVDALTSGEIDFLADVPPDAVQQLEQANFKVDSIPSLEIGFVMFDVKNPSFSEVQVRKAFAQAINKESFLDLANGHAKTVNQFVSNGVFGYNPDLKGIAFDQKAATEQISKVVSGFEKFKVELSFPESLKLLGQFFQEQLKPIGVEVALNPLSDQDLQNKVAAAQLPFYYLGWRNESGDAMPFLKAVLHSRDAAGNGAYNGMNYGNEKVDQLIDKSETNLNQQERLKDMQEVLKIVTEDDVVGVPLFETESLFAYSPDLSFRPRVDSQIYPSSIRNK